MVSGIKRASAQIIALLQPNLEKVMSCDWVKLKTLMFYQVSLSHISWISPFLMRVKCQENKASSSNFILKSILYQVLKKFSIISTSSTILCFLCLVLLCMTNTFVHYICRILCIYYSCVCQLLEKTWMMMNMRKQRMKQWNN